MKASRENRRKYTVEFMWQRLGSEALKCEKVKKFRPPIIRRKIMKKE